MKRFLSLILCILTLCSMMALPVAAAQSGDQIPIAETIIQIDSDCYYVERIYVPAVQPYSNTKTGTKTAEYVQAGTVIYAISVTGNFTYDGSTAKATSASGSITKYVSDLTINSRSAYTSGASAIATSSVSYKGTTLQKTVTLTCDKNGNLS